MIRHRQPDVDAQTRAAGSVGKFDRAAMGRDDFPDDRKPEACSFDGRWRETVEALEHALPFFQRDARAVILHDQLHVAIDAGEADCDRATIRNMAQRVVDEIEDELAEQRNMANHRQWIGLVVEGQIDGPIEGNACKAFKR